MEEKLELDLNRRKERQDIHIRLDELFDLRAHFRAYERITLEEVVEIIGRRQEDLRKRYKDLEEES